MTIALDVAGGSDVDVSAEPAARAGAGSTTRTVAVQRKASEAATAGPPVTAPPPPPADDVFGLHLAVQRHGGGDVAVDDARVPEVAAAGVSGAAGGLPHGETIQRAFGRHDVSGVGAAVGGQAGDAARAIGADAYAMGDKVAFARSPDLFTAAHEAAHVVQQRAGVSLAGGVGQRGDAYERHADEVAHAVVSGGSAEALLDRSSGGGGGGGAAVQRFESDEHRRMGDAGATDGGGVGQVELAPGYTVSHGEMVAMAGDFFGSIDEMRRMAANPGPGASSREEIEYVRVVKVGGHRDRENSYSQAARDAVEARYYRLAANNASHFVNPNAGDAGTPIADRAAAGMPNMTYTVPPAPNSAIQGYRNNHVRAIAEAVQAGRTNQPVASAMAVEAFSAHYLTDSFSAGHQRTQRQSIKQHWDSRVPMFFDNLKGWMAEQVATRVARGMSFAGLQIRDDIAYGGIPGRAGALEVVTQRLDAIGPLGFGDLVSGALHDYDNEHGVAAMSEGARVTLYGDAHAGQGDEEALAVEAVTRSRAEILRAHERGRACAQPQEVIDELLGNDALYNAERMIPVALPDAQQAADQRSIRWDYDTWQQLLADPRFASAAQLFATEKAATMTEVASTLSDPAQRQAIADGVVTPLRGNPIATLRTIINWSPTITDSALGHNTDDNSMDYVAQVRRHPGAMRTLTLEQRQRLMTNILDGATVGDEEDAIMEILRTAPASEQRSLIRHFGWRTLYDKIDDGPGEDFANTFPENQYGQ